MSKKEKKKERTKGEKSPALAAQPNPRSDSADVWPLVIKDMEDRDHLGKVKYGIPLRIHNGRSALVDAYQEVLDLSVYLRQEIEEQEFLRLAVDDFRKIPGFEKTTVSDLGKNIRGLVDFCNDLREKNRVLTASLMHFKTSSSYSAGFDDAIDLTIQHIEKILVRDLTKEEIDEIYDSAGLINDRSNA